jgi:hypothetical protein
MQIRGRGVEIRMVLPGETGTVRFDGCPSSKLDPRGFVGDFERVCGEIQFKRRPGSERGPCSVFASGMTQGLRLDRQKHRCAEPA